MKKNISRCLPALLVALLFVAIFGTPRSYAGAPEEITGAFGYKLGEVFDPWPALSRDKIAIENNGSGQITVKVTPPAPNPMYTDYELVVDLKTHKICSIRATGPAHANDDNFFEKLVQILAAKYGPPSEGESSHNRAHFISSTKGRDIWLNGLNEFSITYTDTKLSEEGGRRTTEENVSKVTGDGL